MTNTASGFGEDPRLDQVRVQVLKLSEKDGVFETRSLQTYEDDARWFENAGALDPPYDPRLLLVLHEHSNALRQNVDAYATNIDGFGHAFAAVIDLEADSTMDEVRTLIALERQSDVGVAQVEEATDEDVKKRILQLANEQRLESLRLRAFFDDCAEMSFVDLRRRTREEVEITGNGYWEVLRDRVGKVAGFNLVESYTMRLCKLDDEFVRYQRKRRTLTQDFEEVTRSKRFRRYVQKVNERAVYFKEFGDPRWVSSVTGKAYETEDALEEKEPGAWPATEMLHFRIPSSRSAYGVPRWIGNLLSVMGSRQSEDVNFQYFENKSVPPLAVLVSGGRLTKDSVEKLESFIKNEIRGKDNFHKILIIEAEGAEPTAFENSGRMKIELKPLTEAQTSDALFQGYDERNIDKVGMSFRLPRMLRGDTRDFNRSCYTEETETLTESGWKLVDDIGPNEKIAAFNKDTGEVVFVVPAEKLVYDVKDELMVVFDNAHIHCAVTDNHRMLLRENATRPWEVHEAAKIPYATFEVQQAATLWAGVASADFAPARMSVEDPEGYAQLFGSVPVPESDDDLLELLGYYAVAGAPSAGGAGEGFRQGPSVELVAATPEIRDRMFACLSRLGWYPAVHERGLWGAGSCAVAFSRSQAWFPATLGVWPKERRLPDACTRLPHRQLRILLDALCINEEPHDQTEERGVRRFVTLSEALASQVQIIAMLLGYRAVLEKTWLHDRSHQVVLAELNVPAYRVTFSEHATTTLHAKERPHDYAEVRRFKYTGRVYCFSVPGYGFFVTRNNGKIAIQGNTAAAALDFAERQVFEPERMSFDYRMNRDILPTLGIKHWLLKSNGPTQRDPESLAKMIHDLQDFMTPNQLLELSQGVFNRNFPRIEAEWADQPLKLTLALVNKIEGETPETEDADPDNQAPNNEPETSTTETADNKGKGKTEQGRASDGKFGGSVPKAPKKRPVPARKARDPMELVAGLLVDVRKRLQYTVIDAAEARIARARADNDNDHDDLDADDGT